MKDEKAKQFQHKMSDNKSSLKSWMASARGQWWWSRGWVLTKRGRSYIVVLGPYPTEDDARQDGFSKFMGDFDVKKLPTRDETKATHYFRYERAGEAGLSESLERFRHHGKDIGID